MGLEKQFDNIEIMFEGQTGQLRYDELNNASKLCVEIAENFAIGFAEWMMEKCDYMSHCVYEYQGDEYTQIELLEIYKKTL